MEQLKTSYAVRNLSRTGQQRLDALMPLLLDAVCKYRNPDISLQRISKLLEAVARRSVYLALLVDHPVALKRQEHEAVFGEALPAGLALTDEEARQLSEMSV